MWFQTGDPRTQGFWIYKYPYHQDLVVPATFDVATCPQLAPIFEAYNARICEPLGAKAANHGIATAYEDGQDCITPHSDKDSTIAPSDDAGHSLIVVLKTGANGRLFEIATNIDKGTKPFFSEELPPGTLLLMTVEANNRTVHSVPAVPSCGPSGSIVFRTIVNRVTVAELERSMRGKTTLRRPAANAAYAVAAPALVTAAGTDRDHVSEVARAENVTLGEAVRAAREARSSMVGAAVHPPTRPPPSRIHTLASLPPDDEDDEDDEEPRCRNEELHCGSCKGFSTLHNPLHRCYYADKPQACRKAWHKGCATAGPPGRAKRIRKYVCCQEHLEQFFSDVPRTKYTCPDATDDGLLPIPPPPK